MQTWSVFFVNRVGHALAGMVDRPDDDSARVGRVRGPSNPWSQVRILSGVPLIYYRAIKLSGSLGFMR